MPHHINIFVKKGLFLFAVLASFLFSSCAGTIKNIQEEPCKSSMPKAFYFAYGSADFDVFTKDSIKNLAKHMSCYKGKLRLEGHTDAVSSHKFNIALGLKRAQNVKDYLVSLGVDSSRIEIYSFGKKKPLAKGVGKDIDALNRCVIVVLVE